MSSSLKLVWNKNEKCSRFAYVFSVFKNSKYLLAALAAGWSLRRTGTREDVVLLVTDIPEEMSELGKHVFDRIYSAPYLNVCCRPLRTEKQRKRYESWMDVSCTKWNCFNLVEYEKIVYLDADVLVLRNIDKLFNLSAPAGTFSSPQAEGYCLKGGMYNPYVCLREGDLVKSEVIEKGLSGKNGASFTVIGTSVVLRPNGGHFSELLGMLGSYSKTKPFGYPACNSGIDEQVLAHFYSKFLPSSTGENFNWTYVSQSSGWIPWHPEWLRKDEWPPSVIHYFGQKFWEMKREDWLDLEPLWMTIQSLVNHVPKSEKEKLVGLYGLIEKKNISGCFYCKILKNGNWKLHEFMNESEIICPKYRNE
jgi:hypothetical protein